MYLFFSIFKIIIWVSYGIGLLDSLLKTTHEFPCAKLGSLGKNYLYVWHGDCDVAKSHNLRWNWWQDIQEQCFLEETGASVVVDLDRFNFKEFLHAQELT